MYVSHVVMTYAENLVHVHTYVHNLLNVHVSTYVRYVRSLLVCLVMTCAETLYIHVCKCIVSLVYHM